MALWSIILSVEAPVRLCIVHVHAVRALQYAVKPEISHHSADPQQPCCSCFTIKRQCYSPARSKSSRSNHVELAATQHSRCSPAARWLVGARNMAESKCPPSGLEVGALADVCRAYSDAFTVIASSLRGRRTAGG